MQKKTRWKSYSLFGPVKVGSFFPNNFVEDDSVKGGFDVAGPIIHVEDTILNYSAIGTPKLT